MKPTIHMDNRGRITLPRALRRQLNVSGEAEIDVELTRDGEALALRLAEGAHPGQSPQAS